MSPKKTVCTVLALLLVCAMTVTAYADNAKDANTLPSVKPSALAALVSGSGGAAGDAAELAKTAAAPLTLDDSRMTLKELLGQATDENARQAYIDTLLAAYDGVMIQCQDCVNIWAEPVKEDSLLTLRNGKVAHLEAIEEGWYQVRFGNTAGYVDADYATLVSYADYEDTSATSTVREDLVAAAKEWLGTPYRYGGSSKKGTDCSGFTMAVFKDFGYTLTHGASDQYAQSRSVTAAERDVGDLVFFSFYGGGIGHVGIYLGGGTFIHASTSQGVIVSSLSDKYYANGYVGAGRILPD